MKEAKKNKVPDRWNTVGFEVLRLGVNYMRHHFLNPSLALIALIQMQGCKTSSESKSSNLLIETVPISLKAKVKLEDESFEVLEDAGFDWDQDVSADLKRGASDDSITLSAQYCETKIAAGKYDFNVEDREIYIQKKASSSARFNILKDFRGSSADGEIIRRGVDGRKFVGTYRLDRGQPSGKTIYIFMPQINFSRDILNITYECKIETRS
jgi:hypothetical protein